MTTLTIRQQLKLAAKAANIGPLDFDYPARDGHGMFFGPRLPLPQGVVMAANHTYWRPDEDDADSQRLAVKLLLSVRMYPSGVCVNRYDNPGFGTLLASEEFGVDRNAAVRRAILRAAARLDLDTMSTEVVQAEQQRQREAEYESMRAEKVSTKFAARVVRLFGAAMKLRNRST